MSSDDLKFTFCMGFLLAFQCGLANDSNVAVSLSDRMCNMELSNIRLIGSGIGMFGVDFLTHLRGLFCHFLCLQASTDSLFQQKAEFN